MNCRNRRFNTWAISRQLESSSGLLVAIQVAQDQFADWSHRNDALGRMFEYNLIPFSPTLQNRVGPISAKAVGTGDACERGKKFGINNQQ
jgi:hypothetical protein